MHRNWKVHLKRKNSYAYIDSAPEIKTEQLLLENLIEKIINWKS